MGKLDDNGQLYELHKFSCGFGVWVYSDRLHKMYHIANMNGFDLDNQKDFFKIYKEQYTNKPN